MTPVRVICRNLTTGQTIQVQTTETSWNCTELGLIAEPGDPVVTGAGGTFE